MGKYKKKEKNFMVLLFSINPVHGHFYVLSFYKAATSVLWEKNTLWQATDDPYNNLAKRD